MATVKIKILCVGKLKENYFKEAEAEYTKRLSKYCRLSVAEVKEERLPENASLADFENVKRSEGQRILKEIKGDNYVIALDILGKSLSSIQFSEKVNNLGLAGKSNIVFIIGGSLGLSEEATDRADFKLSFSEMTFPHQLMRTILLEQIYRSFKIINNETYHK